MNQPMQNSYPLNAQAELARERNHISADRSLLKFIALGTFARLCAALDHREQLKCIQRNDWVLYPSSLSIAGCGLWGWRSWERRYPLLPDGFCQLGSANATCDRSRSPVPLPLCSPAPITSPDPEERYLRISIFFFPNVPLPGAIYDIHHPKNRA
jgi:hypothetical protein